MIEHLKRYLGLDGCAISSSVKCEVPSYALDYDWVHWHPSWTGAISLGDLSILGILGEVVLLIEDHSTLESTGRRGGIKYETHIMFLIHPPGGG